MLRDRPSQSELALTPVATGPSGTVAVGRRGSERERWICAMLGLTVVLNLIDAALTLLFVGTGAAVEANPLMRQLLDHGPLTFVLVKLAIVSLSVGLVWRLRQLRLATFASGAALAIYLMTLLWHMQGLGKI
jgi:hypothetical protein